MLVNRNVCCIIMITLLLLLLVANVTLAEQQDISPSTTKQTSVSVGFTKALDVGMAQVATSDKWQQIFESLGMLFDISQY